MHKRFVGALALLTLAGTALAGCSSDSDSGSGSDGDKPTIAIISKGYQHQFWQAVNEGAQKAAEEFDVEVTFDGPDTEEDIDDQVDMLQTAVDSSPDAIAIAALDSGAVEPVLEQAKDADIPVIAFDSGVDSDIPLTTAATDNEAAAAEAAKHMVELIGGKGKIGIVAHDQTSQTGIQRTEGFVKYIEENAPDVEIVDTQYGGDPAVAADLASTMIEANPDIVGLYGTNEGAATGIVQAVGDNTNGIKVVGFDSGAAQIEAITDGKQAGAITQNPVGIGYETVKAAVEAIDGKDLPKTIDTGYYWYDASNINDEEIQAVLYQ